MAEYDRFAFDGEREPNLSRLPTSARKAGVEKNMKAEYIARTQKNLARIAALQDALYAEGREGLVVVLQAMDAAGKDSTVKHVVGAVNPQGVRVTSFKQPGKEELAHDFLWRAARALPARGGIAIFNRSYYEDVLVVKVYQLQRTYQMADRVLEDEDFFKKRYRHIRRFEEYLYDNSYRVVKIFLHLSKDEQKKRFLERIDDAAKNWKFSASDLAERAHWDEYQQAYQDAISATASRQAPWYVVPADQKWYARYLISQILADTLEEMAPAYPALTAEEKAHLAECKASLLAEGEQED